MDIVNLAIDFGASSGRVVMSRFDGSRISLQEIHRFPNEPVWFRGRYYWDFFRLLHELKCGLKKVAQLDVQVASVGIDAWGVDYGLLDRRGELLSNPIHYRDDRGGGMLEEIERNTSVSFEVIYGVTGIQKLSINSLFQLYYDTNFRPELIEQASALLFMPDLFSYALTGNRYNEYTIASTSQMLDAFEKNWARRLLEDIGLPTHVLQQLIQPGEIWGYLGQDIQEEVGLPAVPVVAVGSHDTASAVAATPLTSEASAFLSCGSWSLLGVERRRPLINRESLEVNFTNEGGVEDTIRYLNNITGLWIIQELRKKWCRTQRELSFAEISKGAQAAEHIDYFIDPSDDRFVAPLDMEDAVREYCMEKLGKRPETIGELARAVYNGIVLEYKRTLQAVEETQGAKVDCIHMVGGGTRDEFLCQLTADRTERTVVAGPIEASILGNVLIQLKALGYIGGVQEGRRLVKRSFALKTYTPSS